MTSLLAQNITYCIPHFCWSYCSSLLHAVTCCHHWISHINWFLPPWPWLFSFLLFHDYTWCVQRILFLMTLLDGNISICIWKHPLPLTKDRNNVCKSSHIPFDVPLGEKKKKEYKLGLFNPHLAVQETLHCTPNPPTSLPALTRRRLPPLVFLPPFRGDQGAAAPVKLSP